MLIATREAFNSLNEDSFRKHVLIPLLHKLNYIGVFENHGIVEFGKDIVAYRVDEMDQTRNIVVVAKVGKISGRDDRDEVKRQVEQSFKTKYKVGTDNIERLADDVYVMTTGSIAKLQRELLESEIDKDFVRHVRFFDGDQVWHLYENNFDLTMIQHQARIQEVLRSHSDDAIELTSTLSADSATINFTVKDISKLRTEHTHGRVNFHLGEDPTTRTKMEKVQNLTPQDEPITFTGREASLEVPEFARAAFEALYGSEWGDETEITISPIAPDPIKVVVELDSDDGDHIVLPQIEMTPSFDPKGILVFSNDHQSYPIKLSIDIQDHGNGGNYRFHLEGSRVSMHQRIQYMDVIRCIAKPGRLTITLSDSGIRIFHGRRNPNPNEQPGDGDEEAYDFYVEMARAEKILGRPLYIRDDDDTPETNLGIRKILRILEDPTVQHSATGGNIQVDWSESDPGLQQLIDGSGITSEQIVTDSVQIGDDLIDLGPVKRTVRDMRIKDLEAVRIASKGYSEGEIVALELVPGSVDNVTDEYLHWVRREGASLEE